MWLTYCFAWLLLSYHQYSSMEFCPCTNFILVISTNYGFCLLRNEWLMICLLLLHTVFFCLLRNEWLMIAYYCYIQYFFAFCEMNGLMICLLLLHTVFLRWF